MERDAETHSHTLHRAWGKVIKQMDLTDFYRTFYPKTKRYTFFSATQGTFSKTDHNWSQNKPQQIQKY